MTLAHFGINISQQTLAAEMKTHPVTGTEYADMAVTLNRHLFNKEVAVGSDPGYRVQVIGSSDSEAQISSLLEKRIRTNVNDGYPTFVAVNMGVLYDRDSSANHMILVIGYKTHNSSDEIESYYTIDPFSPVHINGNNGYRWFSKESVVGALVKNTEPAYIW